MTRRVINRATLPGNETDVRPIISPRVMRATLKSICFFFLLSIKEEKEDDDDPSNLGGAIDGWKEGRLLNPIHVTHYVLYEHDDDDGGDKRDGPDSSHDVEALLSFIIPSIYRQGFFLSPSRTESFTYSAHVISDGVGSESSITASVVKIFHFFHWRSHFAHCF